MTAGGRLEPGDIFRTVTGDVWYVDTVSHSGAYCFHLSAHPTPITTRKGVTKIVNRHLRNSVFSPNSVVDLVDKTRLDPIQLRRRIGMARKEGAVAETEQTAPATTRPAPVRAAQGYVRTDKTPTKEMRGQGKEVMDALNAAGGTPLTAKEVADRCVFAGTRQDKERVAGFYLSQFKKEGFVKVSETPASTDAPQA